METIAIGDACEVLNGYAFKSEKYTSSGIRIIRIANVQKGYIEDNSPVFYPIDSSGLEKYMLREGDLLVSLTGNVGRTALLTEDMIPAALNQRVACLRLKTDKITNRFLFHLLNSDYFETKCIQSSQGVAQKNMSTEWLKSYKLPLYSLSKQNEITKILDNVRNTNILKNQELKRYDDLIKARFVEMFGDINNNIYDYDIRCLNDVCEFIKDGTHQTPIYTQDKENGYKFMSSKDVVLGSIDWNHLKYIPEDLHKELYKHISPRRGDILLAKNGTTGIAAMVDRDEVFDIYVSLAILRPLNINSTYLLFAINSNTTKRQFDACLKGIGVPNLHLGEIKKAKIIVPPLDKQIDFEKYAKQVDKSKFIQMNSTI